MIRPAAVLTLLACAALNGCGTMRNCYPDPDEKFGATRPYGGVAEDLNLIQHYATVQPPFFWQLSLAMMVVDLPLSAAADTIVLPYTVPYWLLHGVGQPAASERDEWALPPDRVVLGRGGIGPGY